MSLSDPRTLSAKIIDLVIQRLGDEHKVIRAFEETYALGKGDDSTARSMLYGEAYYSLEDELVKLLNTASPRTEAAADLINDDMMDKLMDIKVEVFERLKIADWFPLHAEGPDNEEELKRIMHELVERA